MANELVIAPKTFGEVQTMSEALSKSNLLPDALKGKSADVAFQIMTGAELGLSPMASIRGIHVIQGKPVISADTMVALCLGSGLCEYFMQTDATDTSVTYETKRKGAPRPQTCTWTLDMAKRAALHQKDNWRLHPRQMLASRAKAELARSAYPDVLAGCFDPDEMQVPVRQVEPVQDAEWTEAPSMVDEIAAVGNLAELDAMIPKLKTLTGRTLEVAREAYGRKKLQLSKLNAEEKQWIESKQPEARVSHPTSPPASSDSSLAGASTQASSETQSTESTV